MSYNDMPNDVIIKIGKYLSINDLCVIINLNKQTYDILNNNSIIWKYKYHQFCPEEITIYNNDFKDLCKRYMPIIKLCNWPPFNQKYLRGQKGNNIKNIVRN